MYHFDPETALEELNDDAVLPHPVHVLDMIVRAELTPKQALELNRMFQTYLEKFGELQKLVRPVLEELARRRQRKKLTQSASVSTESCCLQPAGMSRPSALRTRRRSGS